MNAPAAMADLCSPVPIEIDPRYCEVCGCLADDREEQIYLLVADLVAQWEFADPRDSWRHTGEQHPRPVEMPRAVARPYCTPQATIDAFFYVVRLDDAQYLSRWIKEHPLDAAALFKLWEGKNARS